MAGPKASPGAPKGARHHAPATATGTILPGAWVAEGCACRDLPEPKSREKIPALADAQLPGRICFWVWQHPDGAGLGAAIPSPAPRTGSLRNQPCSPSAPLHIPQHLPPHASSSGRVPSILTLMPMGQPGQRCDRIRLQRSSSSRSQPGAQVHGLNSKRVALELVWLLSPGTHFRDEPSRGCGCSGGGSGENEVQPSPVTPRLPRQYGMDEKTLLNSPLCPPCTATDAVVPTASPPGARATPQPGLAGSRQGISAITSLQNVSARLQKVKVGRRAHRGWRGRCHTARPSMRNSSPPANTKGQIPPPSTGCP
ncbi:uncharacterized protein ACIBXB_003339 isoform 1-T1 [Morphnus guianensis]